MEFASFDVLEEDKSVFISLKGEWRTVFLAEASARLASGIAAYSDKRIVIDLSGIKKIDSAAALWLIGVKNKNPNVAIFGISKTARNIFRLVLLHTKTTKAKELPRQKGFLYIFGFSVYSKAKDFISYSSFLGAMIYSFFRLFGAHNFRFTSIVKQMELSSVNALPIVALSAFLIGVVVTYQGSIQLERFGAAIFTVDLVGISVTRELAPLLTAVVIAGRSGASYTSEIGVMKIAEEIDAMKTMGFNPFYFLVWPRILALTLTLWLVIFFADVVAIAGGMIIAKLQLGISYAEFLDRLRATLALKHVFVGLFKAPFFAFLIASIGIFRGLQVEGSSESIGVMTTHSVVNSIFAVIACDALFSVIFSGLKI